MINKANPLITRFTKENYEYLKTKAQKEGISMNTLINMITKQERLKDEEEEYRRKIINEQSEVQNE